MIGLPWAAPVVVALFSFAATWVLTWWVRRLLLRFVVLDRPNDRSSHAQPVPRGGGIAVMAVVLLIWAALGPGTGRLLALIALALAALSWVDDLKGLSPAVRLLAQAVAVGAGLFVLPDQPVFQGLLPPLADRAVAALAWLWFVNLYNFMDGIDGITGVETLVIGVGVALVAALGAGPPLAAFQGAALAGAALGFLLWNLSARCIFLGDVGSVGLAYLIGWLLLALAAHGQWAAALLLPLYYLADATWTLGRRLLRRERIWQAHRSHFYQRAAPRPADHARVAGQIGLLGLALIGCALWAQAAPLPALALGGGLTALLLFWFGRVSPA